MKIDIQEREGGQADCVYCREAVTSAEQLACPGCGALFHGECYRELGRCPTPGCQAAPPEAVQSGLGSAWVCALCRRSVGEQDGLLACDRCEQSFHWECWRMNRRCPTPGCRGRARATLATPSSPGPSPGPHDSPPWLVWGLSEPTPIGFIFDEERLQAWAKLPALERSFRLSLTLAVIGLVFGMIGGFLYGGLTDHSHGALFKVIPALKYGLLGVLGGPAGFVYGFLQGVVGLKVPTPKGLGLLTLFIVTTVGLVSYFKWGVPTTVVLCVATSLVCGRLFGFSMPDKNRH